MSGSGPAVIDEPIDPRTAASATATASASAPTSATATGTASAPAARKRPNPKSTRRRSREIALQGLYQWLVSGAPASEIAADMREQVGFDKCDAVHFDALLLGCIAEAGLIDALLTRHVDRKTTLLSPIEHSVLMIGVYELTHCIDIPYRVVINEGVELAKTFGGTDGHKYVNGVLDKAAADLRAVEVTAARAARARG